MRFSECSPSSSPLLPQGSKWRTLRTSWKPGSALALPTAPAISTCACVLTHTGAHSHGQHSHALCLWPLRQVCAHLHRVALGLLQGLVLLVLPGGHSTACSSIQSIGRTLQSILPQATLKGTSLGALRSINAKSACSPSTQASDFQRGSFLLYHRIELSG